MAQQTGASTYSFTVDALTQLKDAGAVTSSAAAQVGGSDRVLDFGGETSGPVVEQVAFTPGHILVDVAAVDFGTTDETYLVIYQLSDNASGADVGFQGGDNIVNKAVILALGAAGGLAGSGADDQSGVGRNVVGVDNEFQGETFRFGRLFHVLAGTTPSINYTAFLSRVG